MKKWQWRHGNGVESLRALDQMVDRVFRYRPPAKRKAKPKKSENQNRESSK